MWKANRPCQAWQMISATVLLFALLPAPAQTNPSATDPGRRALEQRMQSLEQLVGQLQQQNQSLRQELDSLKEAKSTNAPAPAVGVSTNAPMAKTVSTYEAGSKLPYVLPRGNESKLLLEGFLQANTELGDAGSFEGRLAGGPNRLTPRIRLRRARIGVMGDLFKDFDFKLEGDFQQGDGLASGRSAFSGTDLSINWHRFPEANFKVGQFFAPFGYEMLLPDVGRDRILLTAERSLANIAIVPERQVGAELKGKPLANLLPGQANLLSYEAGVFNGNNRNTVVNDNGQFMYVGRVEVVPYAGKLWNQDLKLRLGANALYSRDAAGTLLSHIGNLRLNFADGSLSPYVSSGADERRAWGLDSTLTYGPFELSGEYLEERVRPTTSFGFFPQFTANGYYLQPSYYLWNKKFQLVSKYESFNPGQAPHDTISSLTGGLNYYIYGQNIIAMLNFIHTWSDYRAKNPGAGKSEFNEVLLRLEFYY